MKSDFEMIWDKIIAHEGETFYTPSKRIPFTYVVRDDCIFVSNAPLTCNKKNNIRRAYEIIDTCSRTEFSRTIIGASYVRALLGAFSEAGSLGP